MPAEAKTEKHARPPEAAGNVGIDCWVKNQLAAFPCMSSTVFCGLDCRWQLCKDLIIVANVKELLVVLHIRDRTRAPRFRSCNSPSSFCR